MRQSGRVPGTQCTQRLAAIPHGRTSPARACGASDDAEPGVSDEESGASDAESVAFDEESGAARVSSGAFRVESGACDVSSGRELWRIERREKCSYGKTSEWRRSTTSSWLGFGVSGLGVGLLSIPDLSPGYHYPKKVTPFAVEDSFAGRFGYRICCFSPTDSAVFGADVSF